MIIKAEHIGYVREQLDKLNRRAVRNNLEEITMTETARETKYEVIETDPETGLVLREGNVTRVEFEIVGEPPVLPGNHRLVGAIDHDADGGNILTPGLSEMYRNAPATCDHCDTVRARRDTFIVEDEDGTVRQIGRSCLVNYLPSADVEQLIRWKNALITFTESDWEEEFANGPRDWVGLSMYLEDVAVAIRVWGWTSRTTARESHRHTGSTADAANNLGYARRNEPGDFDVTDAERDLVRDALAWIRGTTDSAEYIANLRAACEGDSFRVKHDGLVASLIGAAYPNHLKRIEGDAKRDAIKAAAAALPPSEFIGEAKQRLRSIPVTVERISDFEGDYGTTYVVAMRTHKGEALVWFASMRPIIKPTKGDDGEPTYIESGEIVSATFTVKRHDLNAREHNEPTTHVNRVVFEPHNG